MCRACRQNCRIVKFDFQCAKFYHDYAKSSSYTKPDLSKSYEVFLRFTRSHIVYLLMFFRGFLSSLFLQSWLSSYKQLKWIRYLVWNNKISINSRLPGGCYILYGIWVTAWFRSFPQRIIQLWEANDFSTWPRIQSILISTSWKKLHFWWNCPIDFQKLFLFRYEIIKFVLLYTILMKLLFSDCSSHKKKSWMTHNITKIVSFFI